MKKENVAPLTAASSSGSSGAAGPGLLERVKSAADQLDSMMNALSAGAGEAPNSSPGTVPKTKAEYTKVEDKAASVATSAVSTPAAEAKEESRAGPSSGGDFMLAELRCELVSLNRRCAGLETENFTS